MKILRLLAFMATILSSLIIIGCVSYYRDTSWYMEQMDAIEEGNSPEKYKKVIGIFIMPFFNNENRQEFSPEIIDYVMVNLNNTGRLVADHFAKEHILIIPSAIFVNDFIAKQPDEIKFQVIELNHDILSIIDEYIQTGIFNENKATQLSFPSLASLSTYDFYWKEKYPLYFIVGLESQKHDKPDHVLGSALGIVRFSGKGAYQAMGIVPYNFTKINDDIYANKIISFISSTEDEIEAL